jgi:hypothetical protein
MSLEIAPKKRVVRFPLKIKKLKISHTSRKNDVKSINIPKHRRTYKRKQTKPTKGKQKGLLDV